MLVAQFWAAVAAVTVAISSVLVTGSVPASAGPLVETIAAEGGPLAVAVLILYRRMDRLEERLRDKDSRIEVLEEKLDEVDV